MQIIWDDEDEHAAFVSLGCSAVHQTKLAREQLLEHDNPTACIAHYYRTDTEILRKAWGFLPDTLSIEIQRAAAAMNNEPGK